MADLQKIVYLSKAQYDTLLQNGSITVGDVTITYSANDLYVVPEQQIPNGGTTGQVLTKASDTDLDTVWATPPYQIKTVELEVDTANMTLSNLSSGTMYDRGYRQSMTLPLTSSISASTLSSKMCTLSIVYDSGLSSGMSCGIFNCDPDNLKTASLANNFVGFGYLGTTTTGSPSYLGPQDAVIGLNISGLGGTITGFTVYWKSSTDLDNVLTSDIKLKLTLFA